ncbi:hypothetical protein UFOVP350_40 [uncultured Caudovirales phage]|uniref:HTH_XRE domain containing protein n=1 Tax=uncultured Caudovirales phage TaxID=2100421 RepID=A0A6J5M201_9CAUD|nr:hypothetical protein UFOVP350_40 [uncultured Caudovirales phage]
MTPDTHKGHSDIGRLISELLDVYGMTQAELASRLLTSPQNLNDRLKKGTFTSKMQDDISRELRVDLQEARKKLAAGHTVEEVRDDILNEPAPTYSRSTQKGLTIELSEEDVREIMINQRRTIASMDDKMNKLMEELRILQKELIESRGIKGK